MAALRGTPAQEAGSRDRLGLLLYTGYMTREQVRPKSNNRPDDDIGDCPAVSNEGYLCTRNRNHFGNHDAKGLNSDSKMSWSDSSTYEDPNPPETVTPRQ